MGKNKKKYLKPTYQFTVEQMNEIYELIFDESYDMEKIMEKLMKGKINAKREEA